VAPLDRAFALAQIDDVAVLVAEQLDLDMARALDELLDEHAVVAEAAQPLALGRLEAFAHVAFGPGQPHPLAAAAGRGLHHHRIADLAGDPHRIVGAGDVAEEAGHDVHARAWASFLDSILSPIAAIAFGGGPIKAMPFSASSRAKLSRSDRSRSRDAPPPRRSPWPRAGSAPP
jgi:hypothetical protein